MWWVVPSTCIVVAGAVAGALFPHIRRVAWSIGKETVEAAIGAIIVIVPLSIANEILKP